MILLQANQITDFVSKNLGQGVAVTSLLAVVFLMFRYIYYLHKQHNIERLAIAEERKQLQAHTLKLVEMISDKNWATLDFVKLVEKIISNSNLDRSIFKEHIEKLYGRLPEEIKKKILDLNKKKEDEEDTQ